MPVCFSALREGQDTFVFFFLIKFFFLFQQQKDVWNFTSWKMLHDHLCIMKSHFVHSQKGERKLQGKCQCMFYRAQFVLFWISTLLVIHLPLIFFLFTLKCTLTYKYELASLSSGQGQRVDILCFAGYLKGFPGGSED